MLDTNTYYYICKNLCSNNSITVDEVISVIFNMFTDDNISRCITENHYIDMFTAKLAEFKKEKENNINDNVVKIRGL